MIDRSARIGKNVKIGECVVIEKDAIIGDDSVIGHHVVIKRGTVIGKNVTIGDHVILGKMPISSVNMARNPDECLAPLTVGADVNVSAGSVIYRGSAIMDRVFVGDLASIRENVAVESESIIGRNVMIEPNTYIGRRVTIQTSSYITAEMLIEDGVFIGPCVSTSNDKYMGSTNVDLHGPILKAGARIGNNASLLPNITVGAGAIVGAGAVVTKDVQEQDIVVGNPARAMRS